jgi:hypothetical protein
MFQMDLRDMIPHVVQHISDGPDYLNIRVGERGIVFVRVQINNRKS